MRIAALLLDAVLGVSVALLLGTIVGFLLSTPRRIGPILVVVDWASCWVLLAAAMLLRDVVPGGSPGRRVIGLRVVGPEGQTPTVGQSIRRNLPILIPGWNLLELRSLWTYPEKARSGDRWARTRVEER